MKFTCLLVFVLSSVTALSQTTSSLSGTVMDEKGKAVENVNVLLLKSSDSSLSSATVTDKQGLYEIRPAVKGNYILLFSKTGFQKLYTDIAVSEENTSIKKEVITLKADIRALKEVVISSKKPFIEQKIDRMIVNIENSIISAGNNGLEVLEKLPGVTVDPNEGLV
ncbi:MAG: carboxypeptidase-like regulatory domain-containing protein [Bacteroidota bacterium]